MRVQSDTKALGVVDDIGKVLRLIAFFLLVMAAIVISELTADRQQCDKTGILIFEKKKKNYYLVLREILQPTKETREACRLTHSYTKAYIYVCACIHT